MHNNTQHCLIHISFIRPQSNLFKFIIALLRYARHNHGIDKAAIHIYTRLYTHSANDLHTHYRPPTTNTIIIQLATL